MAISRRSRTRAAETVELRLLRGRADGPGGDDGEDGPPPPELLDVVDEVNRAAERWQSELAVSIGRARELTMLKETQIRYFEELAAIQPEKGAEPGASRAYSIRSLRRLYALALLGRQGLRPADAADLVRRYAHLIEQGGHRSIDAIATHESQVVVDGFLLSRLASQLIDALQLELDGSIADQEAQGDSTDGAAGAPDRPRLIIRELILPMRAVFSVPEPSAAEIQRVGRELRRDPSDTLIALCRDSSAPIAVSEADAQRLPAPTFAEGGRDDRTVLFYSPERHDLPQREAYQFSAYIPRGAPDRALLLVVESVGGAALPAVRTIAAPARALLLDRVLGLCAEAFAQFRSHALIKPYRYRSDGFPFAQTRKSYSALLELLLRVLFPAPAHALAVLLIPDRLDQPTFLEALAESGYGDQAPRARIALSGEGQGLSGRAYKLREPFLSLDAASDPRVAFGLEESCHSALALPLTVGPGLPPFGVLYLGSRHPAWSFDSELVYVVTLLASILGELLGRRWMTRLRKAVELSLHQRVDELVRWIDGLDQNGPDLERAIERIEALWRRLDLQNADQMGGSLALVVLDIDHYKHVVQSEGPQSLPSVAQLHVRQAIAKVIGGFEGYWFRNDHALLVLCDTSRDQAAALVQRIAAQVRDVPPAVKNPQGRYLRLTISAAVQMLSYADLYYLGRGRPDLRTQLESIVGRLRERTRSPEGERVQIFDAGPAKIL